MSVQYLTTPAGLLKLTADQRKLRRIDRVEERGEELPTLLPDVRIFLVP